MHDLLTGRGLVAVDVALATMATIAALFQYWRIGTWKCRRRVLVGRWLIALGWTSLAARIWQTLITSGDILISLPSLISLILIAAGTILVAIYWRPDRRQ